jgi:predicted PurR-regulated permease PerM
MHVGNLNDRRRRAAAWRSTDVMRTAALVIMMYLVVRLVWFANPLFLTAFLGILFGLAVASGVDLLCRWRIPRGVGAPLVVLAFLGLLVGFGAWLAPTIHEQATQLRRQLPHAIDRVENMINNHRNGLLGLVFGEFSNEARVDSAATTRPGAPIVVPNDTTRAATKTQPRPPVPAAQAPAPAAALTTPNPELRSITRYLFPFLSSTLEIVTGILIILFLSIYIAVDPALYHRGLMHLFPHGRRERAGEVLSAVAAVLRKWLVTQLIAMITIGVVTTIVLLILHVKAAFALGLLSGLLEFIPTVGPIISALPAIAMGFLDSPEKALWVTIAYIGVQFMENHLLIPLLMKGGIDLPPALTILSQALMAILFGFLGLMCAVPILAASMVAIKMLYVEGVVGDKAIGPNENPWKGVET